MATSMDSSFLYLLIGLVVLALVAFLMARRESPKTVDDTATLLIRAANVAFELVKAAEQAWLTGELKKDERSDWVMAQLKELFPVLSESQLRAMILSGVLGLKAAMQSRLRQ